MIKVGGIQHLTASQKRSQSNPRPSNALISTQKRGSGRNGSNQVTVNGTFYNLAQENILKKQQIKMKEVMNPTKFSKVTANGGWANTTLQIQSRHQKGSSNAAESYPQDAWLTQTLPTYNTEGGSGGAIENNNNISIGTNRQSTKRSKKSINRQQVRANSTLGNHEYLNQRTDSALQGGPSYMIGTPYQYPMYQHQLAQPEKPQSKRQKKHNSIGMIEQNDVQALFENHTFDASRQQQLIKPTQQQLHTRFMTTIETYTNHHHRHNNTLIVHPTKKLQLQQLQNINQRKDQTQKIKQLAISNNDKERRTQSQLRQANNNSILNNQSKNGTKFDNFLGEQQLNIQSRQQVNYSPLHHHQTQVSHKRSESVAVKRPESNSNIYSTQITKSNTRDLKVVNNIVSPEALQKRITSNTNSNGQLKAQSRLLHNRQGGTGRQAKEEFLAANNSNGSDKSSLIGDYGGTNPIQNHSNSHSRKAKHQIQTHFFSNAHQQLQNGVDFDNGTTSSLHQQTNPFKGQSQQQMIKLIEKQNIIIEDKETILRKIESKNKSFIKPIFMEDQKEDRCSGVQQKQKGATTTTVNQTHQQQQNINTSPQLKQVLRELITNSKNIAFSKQNSHMSKKNNTQVSDEEYKDSMQESSKNIDELMMQVDINLDRGCSNLTISDDKFQFYNEDEEEEKSVDMFAQDEKQQIKKDKPSKVYNFEIFESSSEEELSQGAYESAAESLQNKEQADNTKQNIEDKQQEKLKRAQRKKEEKRRKKMLQARQLRKEQRFLEKLKTCQYDEEVQDDILQFKDSERSSLLQSKTFMVDTPTRLVNESNEFIIKIRKQSKPRKEETVTVNLKKSVEIESKISTSRKEEQKRKDELLRMFTQEYDQQEQQVIQQKKHSTARRSYNNTKQL